MSIGWIGCPAILTLLYILHLANATDFPPAASLAPIVSPLAKCANRALLTDAADRDAVNLQCRRLRPLRPARPLGSRRWRRRARSPIWSGPRWARRGCGRGR